MKRAIIAVVVLGVCVVLSVLEAKGQGPGSDFHARWLAGRKPGFYDMQDVLGLRT